MHRPVAERLQDQDVECSLQQVASFRGHRSSPRISTGGVTTSPVDCLGEREKVFDAARDRLSPEPCRRDCDETTHPLGIRMLHGRGRPGGRPSPADSDRHPGSPAAGREVGPLRGAPGRRRRGGSDQKRRLRHTLRRARHRPRQPRASSGPDRHPYPRPAPGRPDRRRVRRADPQGVPGPPRRPGGAGVEDRPRARLHDRAGPGDRGRRLRRRGAAGCGQRRRHPRAAHEGRRAGAVDDRLLPDPPLPPGLEVPDGRHGLRRRRRLPQGGPRAALVRDRLGQNLREHGRAPADGRRLRRLPAELDEGRDRSRRLGGPRPPRESGGARALRHGPAHCARRRSRLDQHGDSIRPEAAAEMARRGIFLVPTLYVADYVSGPRAAAGCAICGEMPKIHGSPSKTAAGQG